MFCLDSLEDEDYVDRGLIDQRSDIDLRFIDVL